MNRLIRNINWFLIGMLAAAGVAFCAVNTAQADVITEFGGGIKSPYTTSVVLLPDCHVVVPLGEDDEPVRDRRSASCGGDNPVFVGWPIAWQSNRNGAFTYKVGWFHMSHWTDGGSDREVHMDCLCATVTINWSERKRKRNR